MNLPQLYISENIKVYTYTDFLKHKVPQGGFADTFFKTYKEHKKRIYENALRGFRKDLCEKMSDYYISLFTNNFNEEMRDIIDIELHKYMMENNGIIDSLPYPIIMFDIAVETTVREYDSMYETYDSETFTHSSKTIVYDHFGTECSASNNTLKRGERKYRFRKLICENEYSKILSENKLQEYRITQAQNMPKEKFKNFICNIPLIIGIMLPLFLIISHIFKWENVIQTIGKYIPFYLSVCEVNGYSLIHIVAIFILGLLLSSFLRNIIDPHVDDSIESLEKLQKEHKEFLQKYDLDEVAENEKKYIKEFNDLSKKWYLFWFESTK